MNNSCGKDQGNEPLVDKKFIVNQQQRNANAIKAIQSIDEMLAFPAAKQPYTQFYGHSHITNIVLL